MCVCVNVNVVCSPISIMVVCCSIQKTIPKIESISKEKLKTLAYSVHSLITYSIIIFIVMIKILFSKNSIFVLFCIAPLSQQVVVVYIKLQSIVKQPLSLYSNMCKNIIENIIYISLEWIHLLICLRHFCFLFNFVYLSGYLSIYLPVCLFDNDHHDNEKNYIYFWKNCNPNK